MRTPPELSRCGRVVTEPSIAYRDEARGVPVHDDRVRFEILTLEGAQAGLTSGIGRSLEGAAREMKARSPSRRRQPLHLHARTRRVWLRLGAIAVSGLLVPVAVAVGGDGVDGPPVTRSQAILIADRFARVHWTMREINRVGRDCGGGFESTYPLGARIGMAYKWGGWDEVDDFLRKLAEGYGAGTGAGSSTYDAYPRACVTGTSCAGLVSRAWRLNHKYTLNYKSPRIRRKLGAITHPVPEVDVETERIDGLRKGDALINDRHVMLFVYETRDGTPMVLDARRHGVRFRRTSWQTLAENGYEAIRYNNIREDADPRGTTALPIEVCSGALPFTWAGNTRDVVSMAFDTYPVDPGRDQPGPEVIFALEMLTADSLIVRLTDFKEEGIDNDLFLLASLEISTGRGAVDALEGSDRGLSIHLEKGRYFLVVDSGKDLPGEFTLRIDRP